LDPALVAQIAARLAAGRPAPIVRRLQLGSPYAAAFGTYTDVTGLYVEAATQKLLRLGASPAAHGRAQGDADGAA
jgi:streptomycin 6-kinase